MMSNVIFHIDVNSAYLSWTSAHMLESGETLDLRAIPSIIGGDEKSRRGIVLAKSVPAKAFGIVTGEPVAAALKKCPMLTIAPPDHTLYAQYSRRLMELLHTYTSDIEKLSVDECFLYYTPVAHRFPSCMEAAHTIKDRIREELGFTVNIGIAPNKLLAKMASDFQKPDRVHTLWKDEIPQKMWPLPVGELYMVGHASASRLNGFGIHTIGELAAADPEFLTTHFKSHGRQMWEFANGIDNRPVTANPHEAKGIGNSTTLKKDAVTAEEAKKVLLTLAISVSGRLREAGQLAGSICVELKYHTFETVSHQTTLLTPTSTTGVLHQCACQLFDEVWNGGPIRLLGIRTTKLVPEDTPTQMSIFDFQVSPQSSGEIQAPASSVNPEKQKKLDAALDHIRKRFGDKAVTRGSLLIPPSETNEDES